MAEYIQSNDDSSNLALYAGIGVAAVGGAALAYRMSRDPSNGKTVATGVGSEKGKGIVMRYDGEPGTASGFRGGLRTLTKGLFSKDARIRGMNEMSQAMVDSVSKNMGDLPTTLKRNMSPEQANWVGKMDVLKEIGEGIDPKRIQGELDLAKELINNGGTTKKGKNKVSPKDALDEILLSNPYSNLTEEDIIKSMGRDTARAKKASAEAEANFQAEKQKYVDQGMSHRRAGELANAPSIDDTWASEMDAHQAAQKRTAHMSKKGDSLKAHNDELEEKRIMRDKYGITPDQMGGNQIETQADIENAKRREASNARAAEHKASIVPEPKKATVSERKQFATDARSTLLGKANPSEKMLNNLRNQAEKLGINTSEVDKIASRVANREAAGPSMTGHIEDRRTDRLFENPVNRPDEAFARSDRGKGINRRAKEIAVANAYNPVAAVKPASLNKDGKPNAKDLKRYNQEVAQARNGIKAHYANQGTALRNDLRSRGHKIGNRPTPRKGFAKMLSKAL